MNELLTLPDYPARCVRPAPPVPPGTQSATQVIGDVRPQSLVVIQGMIRSTGTIAVGGGPSFHFMLVDGSGEIDVLFLGRPGVRGLLPGTRVTLEGRIGTYDRKLALWNPRYRIESAV
ncbi:MAG TPA: hypothetical protein VGS19_00070 [Streptosporangiaceae bacterium]|nr:hypothetical protein [Streptosporangiaceae bacterium]